MIPETPYLFSIAALSVSLAGFAGLITALHRGSEWRAMDLFRVRETVEFGFVNAFLALVVVPSFLLRRPMLAFIFVHALLRRDDG